MYEKFLEVFYSLCKMSSNNPSLASRSLSAVKWNYIGVVVRIAMQLAVQITLARMLGPNAMGVFAVAFLLIGIGSILVEMGLGAALVQQDSISDNDVRSVFTWTLLAGGGAVVFVFASAEHVAVLFNDPEIAAVLRGITPVFLLQALSVVPMSLLRRELKFKEIQFIQLGSYFFGFLVVGVGAGLAGFGIWSLVAAWVAQFSVLVIVSFSLVRLPKRPILFSKNRFFQFGSRVTLTNLANWIVENVDNFLVGKLFGAKSLGLYSVSYNLVRTPANHLVVTLQGVLFPASARAQSNSQSLKRVYLLVASAVALVSIPAFSGLAVVAETVVDALFGDQWFEAASVLVPLSLAMIPHTLMAIAGPILWGKGKVGDELVVQVLVAALLIVAIWCASSYSVFLMAWMVLLVYWIRFAAITMALMRRISVSFRELILSLKGGALVALAISLVLICTEIGLGGLPSLYRLVVQALLASFVFFMLIFFFPRTLLSLDLLLLSRGVFDKYPQLKKNIFLRRLCESVPDVKDFFL